MKFPGRSVSTCRSYWTQPSSRRVASTIRRSSVFRSASQPGFATSSAITESIGLRLPHNLHRLHHHGNQRLVVPHGWNQRYFVRHVLTRNHLSENRIHSRQVIRCPDRNEDLAGSRIRPARSSL